MSPPNASLILIMVCFWLTFWLVHRFLIRPIRGVLNERAQRIEAAQREWQAKNEDYVAATARLADEVEAAAREGARLRGELRQRAVDQRQEQIGLAREAAEERLKAAVTGIAADAEAARAELGERARDLARLLAGQLLGREVKP
jgi:F-type H+-transporting ATPase subunit b